jgi:hypothetical protein
MARNRDDTDIGAGIALLVLAVVAVALYQLIKLVLQLGRIYAASRGTDRAAALWLALLGLGVAIGVALLVGQTAPSAGWLLAATAAATWAIMVIALGSGAGLPASHLLDPWKRRKP